MKRHIFLLVALALTLASPSYGGAWGHKSFQNDDALDWVSNSLKRSKGLSAVEGALSAVLKNADYLEAPECANAIAACEVLAAAAGKPAPDLPEEVTAFLKQNETQPGAAVLKNAKMVLDRILAASELQELWSESPDFEKWKAAVEDLKRRL